MKRKMKKRMQKTARSGLSMILAVMLFFSTVSMGSLSAPQEVQAGSVTTALGVGFMGCGKIFTMSQNLANLGGGASGETVALTVLDSIFGSNLAGKKTTDDWVKDTYNKVGEINKKVDNISNQVQLLTNTTNEMNGKLNVLGSKMDQTNNKLDSQAQTLSQITDTLTNVQGSQTSVSGQISTLQSNLSSQLGNLTNTLSVALYNSTAEVTNANNMFTELNNYYQKFDGLSSSEQTNMSDLKDKQTDYENFMTAVQALDSGTEIMELVNRITLNFDESYAAFTPEEQTILGTKVTVKDYGTLAVKKFLSDYMDSMYTYMTTVYGKSNGYTSNMYDTTKLMGEYILGETATTGKTPIGKLYYQMSMLDHATSDEVHVEYDTFMDSILQQYYSTAYLCQLSLSYKIAYEVAHDGNTSDIRTYRTNLSNINTQMNQILAYVNYERMNCRQSYDLNEYVDSDFTQYLCYYGNTVNAKNGIKNWKCMKKKDVYATGGISQQMQTLAMGESQPLYAYYGTKDITKAAVWSTTDSNVAVVGADGVVSAVSAGETTITATYDNVAYTCTVVVQSALAIANGTNTSNYHYANEKYSVTADTGYDYYYNVSSYNAAQVALSEEIQAVSIGEATGLSDSEMEGFNWSTASEGVAGVTQNQIYVVDNGVTAIFGYRDLEGNGQYEYIGIPVTSSMDTSAALEKDTAATTNKDYSGYTEIDSAADLIALSQNQEGWSWGSESKYVLTSDIDLGGREWVPIGYAFGIGTQDFKGSIGVDGNTGILDASKYTGSTYMSVYKPFCGTFDGNGYTISNFKITEFPFQKEMADAMTTAKAKKEALIAEGKHSTYSITEANELNQITLGLFGATEGAELCNVNITGAKINLVQDLTEGGTLTVSNGTDSYDLALNSKKGIDVYAGALVGYSSGAVKQKVYEALAAITKQSMDSFNAETATIDLKILEQYIGTYDPLSMSLITAEKNEQRRYYETHNALYLMYSDQAYRYMLNDCYVEGKIQVTLSGNKGGNQIGMLAGCLGIATDNCRVLGTITAEGAKGAVGGLAGRWFAYPGSSLLNSTAQVNITSSGGDVAGGFVGDALACTQIDPEMARITQKDLDTLYESGGETMSFATQKSQALPALILVSEWAGAEYVVRKAPTDDNMNAAITGCQVLGSVSGGDIVGGLIGTKSGKRVVSGMEYIYDQPAAGEILSDDKLSATYSYDYYNLDLSNNYVVSDLTTTGEYAGGILGQTSIGNEVVKDLTTASDTKKVTDHSGSMTRCYYYGSLTAGKAATSLVGNTVYDNLNISKCIVVPTTIAVGDGTSDEVALAPAMFEAPQTSGYVTCVSDSIYYYTTDKYNQFTLKKANSITTYEPTDTAIGVATDAAALNKADTYMTLWDNNSFLELGGILDVENGIIPSVLTEKYLFPLGQAKKYYTVGDTFQPITSVRLFNGVGSTTATSGVTSSTPDMSKAGIRQVSVSYGTFKDTYWIYIYPTKDSCIRVTEKPNLVINDSAYSLSGGQVIVYDETGTAKGAVAIDQCQTAYDAEKQRFTISYGAYTTSMKLVNLYVYSNPLDASTDQKVELLDQKAFLEGTTVKASEVLQKSITSKDKKQTYDLLGSSIGAEGLTLHSDAYVTSLYLLHEDPVKTYTVTVQNDGHGTAKADPETAVAGTSIKLTAVPANGYEFKEWQIVSGKITISKNQFTMPDQDVTVKAVFTEKNASGTITNTTSKVKKGTTVVKSKIKYKVTKVNKNGTGTVTIVGTTLSKKTTKTISIPATIKIENKKFEVKSIANSVFAGYKNLKTLKIGNSITSIGKSTFSGCSKLTKVTIGTGLTSIGSKAFYNCKQLKTITIKSSKLKSVGSKAITGINKKAKIKVPTKKQKAYKKLFSKKTGFKKGML